MGFRSLAPIVLSGLLLAGCVAPEEPPQARVSRPAPTAKPPSSEKFDDAPIPNRKVAPPTGDSVIRIK